MTQLLIDNATSISRNRLPPLASTTTRGGKVRSFRTGPYQTTLDVEVSAMDRDIWRQVSASLSAGLAGPYNFTLPGECFGATHGTLSSTVSVSTLAAGSTSLAVNLASSAAGQTVLAGTTLKFQTSNGSDSMLGSYLVTSDMTLDSSGDGTLNWDMPTIEAVVSGDSFQLAFNSSATYSYYLISTPTPSFVPSTGHVVFNGAFRFIEQV